MLQVKCWKLKQREWSNSGLPNHCFQSTTFDSMFSSLSKYGFSAAINDGVITLSSSQYIVGGSMAELLGIETYATSDAYTVGEAITSTGALTYTDTIIATASALIKD